MKNRKKLIIAFIVAGFLAYGVHWIYYNRWIDPFDELIQLSNEADYSLYGLTSDRDDSIKALNTYGSIITRYKYDMEQYNYRDSYLYMWYESRADLHLGLGNYRLAIEDLNRIIAWNKERSNLNNERLMKLYMKRSNAFLKNKDFENAIIDTDNALAAFEEVDMLTKYYRNDERELADIYSHRAKVYFENEDFEKAYGEIEKALGYRSSVGPAAVGFGLDAFFDESNRFNLAKEIIFAGDILAKMGDYHSATNYYSATLEAAHTLTDFFRRNIEFKALQQRIKSYFYIGQYKESFEDGNKLLSLYGELQVNPPSEIYRYRGRSRYVLGDRFGAKDDMVKAKELNESDGLAHLYLGLLRIERNNVVEGCTDLRRAAENNVEEAFNFIREFCR